MTNRRKNIKKSAKKALLPEAVTEFLKKALIRSWGAVLVLVALAAYASFVSYDIHDPSWNNEVVGGVGNWLGAPGAYVADLLIQSLGLGAVVLVFPFLTWGWRVISLQGLPFMFRHLLLLPVVVLLASLASSLFPANSHWPLTTGMGGILGDLLKDNLMSVWAMTGVEAYPVLMGLVALGLMLLCLLYVLGLEREEWRAIGRFLVKSTLRGAAGIGSGMRWVAAQLRREPVESGNVIDVSGKKKKARKEPVIQKTAEPVEQKSIPVVDTPKPREARSRREEKEKQPMLDIIGDGEFALPPLSLLSKAQPLGKDEKLSREALEQNARMLESVLDDFGVQGEITQVRPGPVVTLYELEPSPGTKSSRVINLADDIARSMSAISARVAVVPGKNAIGIELPNSKREIVALRELLTSPAYEDSKAKLPLTLGKDIGGEPIIADLAAMPHLLVAGTTGSGKSVAINVMILSLLYKLTPEQCRLIMIDPKMLELSVYDNIPHLLTPVVTDPKKAVVALKWAVQEMDHRYQNIAKLQVRNISAYNQRLEQARKKGEDIVRRVQTGFNPESGEPVYEEEHLDLTPLPMIVIVVDEMADLMLVAGKDIEVLIQRLAQKARAAGIHLIMATQRPSVDVITGTIKANLATRISFQVTSKIDSRTILGEQGAEQLLGMGDMLYMAGGGRITRVHGPFVRDEEVERVADELRKQGWPDYLENITEEPDEGYDNTFLQHAVSDGNGGKSGSGDDLYDQAVAIVARDGKASTSYVQRQLQIGYNRAANIIDRMEREGVVSAANHVGKREVLIQDHSGGN
ncbi:FtsK/SpoIIIE family DNA translocase [Emcibacter sp.]|uniref:FtsK/SpoIIIE family DNA translocase n=1 Tax=Emcibacter sp. TaxID=1979954 RepID=UPI002AA698AE|nr:DNA translocase FtsK 4TM domain-containing protein [Emcibacter sp.]